MMRIKEILLTVMEVMWYVKMEEGSGMSKWKRETTSSQTESQPLLSSTRYLPGRERYLASMAAECLNTKYNFVFISKSQGQIQNTIMYLPSAPPSAG
jgi:hypothetical protein